jgi:hypothetical protein
MASLDFHKTNINYILTENDNLVEREIKTK